MRLRTTISLIAIASVLVTASTTLTASPALAASAPTISVQPVGGVAVSGGRFTASIEVEGDPVCNCDRLASPEHPMAEFA